MVIDGIKIDATFSPQHLQQYAFTTFFGDERISMEIGILEPGTRTLNRLPLTVPLRALRNGKLSDNWRTTRMTHFLNVIRTWATVRYNVQPDEDVVFIRFIAAN
jgi:hypothetical protein